MDEYVKISEVMDAIDEQIVRLNESDRRCVTTAKINVMAIRKRVRDLPTIWVRADDRDDQECARQKI